MHFDVRNIITSQVNDNTERTAMSRTK